MKKIFALMVLSVFSVVLMAKETPTTSIAVECPSGGPHFILWIEGLGGTCLETSSGVYECWEAGQDYARASCESSCETTTIETVAGCLDKSNHSVPNTVFSEHEVACHNQRHFDLKGVPGDTCTSNQNLEGQVTGGTCQQTDSEGAVHVSAEADCDTGCVQSSPPGDCDEE